MLAILTLYLSHDCLQRVLDTDYSVSGLSSLNLLSFLGRSRAQQHWILLVCEHPCWDPCIIVGVQGHSKDWSRQSFVGAHP